MSLAISYVAKTNAGPVLAIAPDTLAAQRLEYELRFFTADDPTLPILTLPDWETLPYDTFSPHQDIISDRLTTLYRLPALQRGIIIASVSTIMHRLAPRDHLEAHTFLLDQGESIDLNEMRLRLESSGYRCVSQVMEHGEFTIRGSLLDLFPMGSPHPFRIDLFDQEIDSIRTFDPENQRTVDLVSQIHLLPAREFPFTEDAITTFRTAWRTHFSGDPTNCQVYRDISKGIAVAGVEYYLPLFFEETQTLFDYLPNNSLILQVGDLNRAIEHFWNDVSDRYEQRRFDISRPLLPPGELFLRKDKAQAIMSDYASIALQPDPVAETAKATAHYQFDTTPLPELNVDTKADKPLETLHAFIQAHTHRILFCVETAGRRESLLDLFKTISLHPTQFDSWQAFLNATEPVGIAIAPLDQGLSLVSNKITLITEAQLLGQRVMQRRHRKSRTNNDESLLRNLSELSIGSPIVHIDHGIGRYLGLKTIDTGAHAAEYLTLEYAGNDKLYVPVSSLHLVSRYSGADIEHAPLHKLGNERWQNTKRKAAERARDVAVELLDVYARRAAHVGFEFILPEADYARFCASFAFEETPDQQQAIDNVLKNMCSPQTMDHLICGDVGFGKTEVAMRAAFIAVQNNKQVAILVPTTLLTQQHFENFRDRFAEWPVKVDSISRFRSKKEQDDIIGKLHDGTLDIVIGTHKLLQNQVKFKDLGLLIIDEEHRFGVRQKERIKSLRTHVDILSMTATPIPRTLNMALSGIRDLSIIATPPARRLSIKTFVREYNPVLVREAITRETHRGGQVYFLHNQVETIEKISRELKELIPEAQIAVAHGQMRERELEQVMTDFYHRRYNVLICTTIIETGIDVPTANTIIIDRADKLGLAQLHQLRGRVGRSHHQAYAYLMTPSKQALTDDALKRLDAIEAAETLGAGFTLATHDLEIRGAGEFLGDEQSGNIQAIGFSLYMEMLDKAVEAIKSGKEPSLTQPLNNVTEVDLQLTALIPEDYLPDVHSRLVMYKRISNAPNAEALEELQIEMIDRFGLLTDQIKNLFQLTALKLKAQSLDIHKIEAGPKTGRIEFTDSPNINPAGIIKLVQEQPERYQLDGPTKLRFTLPMASPETRIQAVELVLTTLHTIKV